MTYLTATGVPLRVLERAAADAAVLDRATSRLLDLLRNEGIDDPLGQSLTLCCVLADLYTLAGVPVPDEVAARVSPPR